MGLRPDGDIIARSGSESALELTPAEVAPPWPFFPPIPRHTPSPPPPREDADNIVLLHGGAASGPAARRVACLRAGPPADEEDDLIGDVIRRLSFFGVADEEDRSSAAGGSAVPLRADTLCEATARPLFWALSANLLLFDVFWAGWNYHFTEAALSLTSDADIANVDGGSVDITSSRLDRASRLARAYYLPLAVWLNGTDIAFGLCVTDRLTARERTLVLAFLTMGCALVAASLVHAHSEAALSLFAVAYGTCCGARESLKYVVLSSLFGTTALGRIQGAMTAFNILSTGAGPIAWAMCLQQTGSVRIVALGSSSALLCTGALTVAMAMCLPRTSTRR